MTTTHDFGHGPVPAHQHPNGGGWVADTAHVAPELYIGPRARVAGGTIRGGDIWGGTIWGGVILGGTIWGGTIWDGTIRSGAIEGGTIRGGTIWDGTIWGGTIRGGTIWGGTIRGGTIWDGTIWDGTIWGGDIWGGVILGGTIEDGTIWDGTIIKETPPGATRSDGYMFLLLAHEDGTARVTAGCRSFTLPEARSHWEQTRGGTRLGDETTAILDYLERMGRIAGLLP